MLRLKLPLITLLLLPSICYGAPAPSGPGPDQLAATQNWLAASKDIDWAHPAYFDGRKGTDALIVADNSPPTTVVVCDDAPVGNFGMARFTTMGGPAKKGFPVAGGGGGACYLFHDVTFLQLNVATDSPRWWGRFYSALPKKK